MVACSAVEVAVLVEAGGLQCFAERKKKLTKLKVKMKREAAAAVAWAPLQTGWPSASSDHHPKRSVEDCSALR